VFRTNASHDRFSDGRKTWSNVVMACRDIATASYIHIDKVHHQKLASLLMMFVICLKQHLQGEFVLSEIQPFVDNSSLDPKVLMKYRNQPIFILKTFFSLLQNKQ
jgi:predicted membrane chloride channel (bestrophin family)